MPDRIEGSGTLEHADQEGAFGKREIRRIFGKINLRRGGDPVGAPPEIRDAQVHLQNFLLRIISLYLNRRNELPDFARKLSEDRFVRILQIVKIAGELLLDRTRAFAQPE